MFATTAKDGIVSTSIPADKAWFSGQTTYMAVTVDGNELSPRILVTAVPYAMSANSLNATVMHLVGEVVELNGQKSPDPIDGTWTLQPNAWDLGTFGIVRYAPAADVSKSLVITPAGNAGFGLSSPAAKFHIRGASDGDIPALRLDQYGSGINFGLMFTEPGVAASARIYMEEGMLTVAAGHGEYPAFRVAQQGEGAEAGIQMTSPHSEHSGRMFMEEGVLWIGQSTSPQALALLPDGTVKVRGTARCEVLQITSDRAKKERFEPVNAHQILQKVASLPIGTWAYTNAPNIRHLGPMAQDFQASFSIGEDDKHIATVDADGVALASIQALYLLAQERDAKIHDLEKRLEVLERKMETHFADSEGQP